jgi:hypothetical protein
MMIAILTKRNWRLGLLLFGLLFLLGAVVLLGVLFSRPSRLAPHEMFDAIHKGMTKAEVLHRVGLPDRIDESSGSAIMRWYWFEEPDHDPSLGFNSTIVEAYLDKQTDTVSRKEIGYSHFTQPTLKDRMFQLLGR